MYLSEEILWPKFKTLNEIRNLPLQEQVRKYNIYLEQLNNARFHNWYSHQPKGSRKEIQITGILLQEDLFDLLQEDGSQIYITSEVTI
jgi:hypothetical protein